MESYYVMVIGDVSGLALGDHVRFPDGRIAIVRDIDRAADGSAKVGLFFVDIKELSDG